MTPDQRLFACWAAISSTVYAILVFIAGFKLGNEWAWKGAILMLGICYFSYGLQMHYAQFTSLVKIVSGLTIVAGLVAGLSLLR